MTELAGQIYVIALAERIAGAGKGFEFKPGALEKTARLALEAARVFVEVVERTEIDRPKDKEQEKLA